VERASKPVPRALPDQRHSIPLITFIYHPPLPSTLSQAEPQTRRYGITTATVLSPPSAWHVYKCDTTNFGRCVAYTYSIRYHHYLYSFCATALHDWLWISWKIVDLLGNSARGGTAKKDDRFWFFRGGLNREDQMELRSLEVGTFGPSDRRKDKEMIVTS
jgi:hypothetical protein